MGIWKILQIVFTASLLLYCLYTRIKIHKQLITQKKESSFAWFLSALLAISAWFILIKPLI